MKWFKRNIYNSKVINVFHLCVHKTGSQWIRKLLSDNRTYRYSGLTQYAYYEKLSGGFDPRKITERSFDEPFPENVIVSPIYIDYYNYLKIPKPDKSRGFFVQRDPRDILVSWYFSMKYSHAKIADVYKRRLILNDISLEDGLSFAMSVVSDTGLFCALKSWAELPEGDNSVLVVRYEDLIGPDQFEHFKRIFLHIDIPMPDRVLKSLLKDNSFEKLSGGRVAGEENVESHYRKGIEGDWRNVMTPKVVTQFKDLTGDLVEKTGYSWEA